MSAVCPCVVSVNEMMIQSARVMVIFNEWNVLGIQQGLQVLKRVGSKSKILRLISALRAVQLNDRLLQCIHRKRLAVQRKCCIVWYWIVSVMKTMLSLAWGGRGMTVARSCSSGLIRVAELRATSNVTSVAVPSSANRLSEVSDI